jgi:hypothetical protein
MKIQRIGNVKGIDEDYKVNVDSPEEVQELHQKLLDKGLLFTYARGDIPYQKFESDTILHYIDKNFKTYDYAIHFIEVQTKTAKERKERSLDTEYQRAKTDPEFKKELMKFMKYHKPIAAFKKHMRAYGEPLKGEYKDLFKKFLEHIKRTVVELEVEEYTIDNLRKLDGQLKELLLPKD